MRLSFFNACTDPIPVNGYSIEEITITKPGDGFYTIETPLLNKWKVWHIYNGSTFVAIVYYWDYKKVEWHQICRFITPGMSWSSSVWPSIRTSVRLARESMLP